MIPAKEFDGELWVRAVDYNKAISEITRQNHDCSRSHPHEEMSKECELRTVIARLENKIANQPNHQWTGLTDSNKLFLIRSAFENSWTKLTLIEEVEQMLKGKND